jgi:DNA invertase Pin-like site-specific DNA recombinase
MAQSIKYFEYVRKSTDDKTHQILSLSAQANVLREFANRERITIHEVLEEARSAKLPGRPVFSEMLDRIERGEANGILCWDIDRLYRNPIDEGRVRWLLQNNVIKSIRTPSRQFMPEDAGLLMGVEGGRATDYIIRLAKNVKRGMEEKLRRGEWPGGNKPFGYLYDRNVRNIVPDPHRWKIAHTIFEEYADGRHGLATAAERLFKFGVTSRSGKQWSKFAVWQFLTNPLYIGVMEWGGKTYEGKFKTFIPPELFNKVQAVLKNKSKPRKVRNGHNFPFCGLFRCTCGSMMTAQWAKGNGGTYCYYRCSRKAGECSEPYVQDKAVIDQCLAFLKPVGITPEQAHHLHGLIETRMNEDASLVQGAVAKLNDGLSAVQEKLNKLTRGYLDEVIDEDSYQTATKDLLLEKTTLKKEKERIQKTKASAWIEPTKRFVNTLEMALKQQSEQSPQEIANVVHKVGTNRLIARKTVTFSFAEPYDFIPSLLASRHVNTTTTRPLLSSELVDSSIWCSLLDYVQTHFSNKSVTGNGA